LFLNFCAPIRNFRNELNRVRDEIDEIYVRTQKIDTLQKRQNKELKEIKADIILKLESIERKLASLETRIDEMENFLRKGKIKKEEVKEENEEMNLYSQALRDYTKGEYSLSINEFEEFIKRYPESDYIIDAKYFLADSYLGIGEKEKAKELFKEIYREYPKSQKARYSLLKLAILEEEEGNKEMAKKYYEEIIKNFPETEEAIKAREKIKEIK
jgi:tol-pal system protein YbgF